METGMSKEVSISEATGELTNASVASGKKLWLVRRPEDEGRPDVPSLALHSHLREVEIPA